MVVTPCINQSRGLCLRSSQSLSCVGKDLNSQFKPFVDFPLNEKPAIYKVAILNLSDDGVPNTTIQGPGPCCLSLPRWEVCTRPFRCQALSYNCLSGSRTCSEGADLRAVLRLLYETGTSRPVPCPSSQRRWGLVRWGHRSDYSMEPRPRKAKSRGVGFWEALPQLNSNAGPKESISTGVPSTPPPKTYASIMLEISPVSDRQSDTEALARAASEPPA